MIATHIRTITLEDVPSYNAYRRLLADEPDNMIVFSAGEYTRSPDEDYARILDVLNHPDQQMLVAATSTEVVGSCFCRGVNSRSAIRHVVGLGIDLIPAYRGQGLGSALMGSMIAWAQAHPIISRIELEVFAHNRRAINLYLKHNFVFEGLKKRAYYKYGRYIDAYTMALILDDKT